MKNIYGTIGYTVLKNNKSNNKIIIFADKHDNLPKCNDKTNIAEWLKQKMHSSKILLEEVPRNSVNLEELWSDSEHTQELKNLYLENSSDINGLDIRPLLIPFSWELATNTEPAHNITIKNYLEKINHFFIIENEYLVRNLQNYSPRKLSGTKLGEHFILLKNNFKKLLENNREFLYFSVHTIKKINLNFLESVNLLLDQIMEWYICAVIIENNETNTKPIIVHAGLAHSDKIVQLLQFHYQWEKINEKGINNLDLAIGDNMPGCMQLPTDTDRQFGGKIKNPY
jgi:hypothetical protein